MSAVNESMNAFYFVDFKVMEIGEVFDGPTVLAPGHAENYDAVWFQEPTQIVERDRYRRRYVLEHIGGDNKIQRAFKFCWRRNNIEPRLGMVVRVRITKFLREWYRVAIPIRHSYAADLRLVWKVWQS